MQTESIELGFLSIFALIAFFTFLIIEKLSNKDTESALLDNDFSKPQSFHNQAVSRSGGMGCFFFIGRFFKYLFFIIFRNSLCLFFCFY